jgi:uncharacterized protein YlxW (UPF0749 family)
VRRVTSAQICLTVVCLLFGALLMVQFRTQGKIAKQLIAESATDQAQIVSNLYDANSSLRKELATLDEQVRKQQDEHGAPRVSELMSDLQKFKIVNGTTQATGPGVEMTIAADLRTEDLQDLVNELRNAGAEGLALNGQRITVRSAISSDRTAITLSGQRLQQPYVFTAIGVPDTLERALTRKGGLVSYLQNTYPEGKIEVVKQRQITLPVASEITFQVAQPVQKTG